jgi:hypothetical protein
MSWAEECARKVRRWIGRSFYHRGSSGSAGPLGGGALFRLALSHQKDEQRLGEALHERRSVSLHSHDTLYVKALRLLMRLFPMVSDDHRE